MLQPIAQLKFPASNQYASLFKSQVFLDSVLPAYLPKQRWFSSKSKKISSCHLIHCFNLTEDSFLCIVSVQFIDGSQELYQLPLAIILANEVAKFAAGVILATNEHNAQELLVDAVGQEAFRKAIFESIRTPGEASDGLTFDRGGILDASTNYVSSRLPAIDTSNTAIIYNERFFFKLFRKLDPGLNPDLELTRYLSEESSFNHCPTYGGSISVAATEDTDFINLGMMIGLVENKGDAWAYFQELTETFYDNIIAKDLADSTPPPFEVVTAYDELSNTVKNVLNRETYERARLLGQRTGEMHLALSTATENPELRPEPFTTAYRDEVFRAANKLLDRQFSELRYKLGTLPPAIKATADSVLLLRQLIEKRLAAIQKGQGDLTVCRIHADYHLGQVLATDSDFVIIDFEGEPLLSIPERRRKRPPFKDLAGMVRSFHYAAMGQLLLNEKFNDQQRQLLSNWGEWWFRQIRSGYLNGYMSVAEGASFVPNNSADREDLLDFFVLEKAIYEVAYELNCRPKWLPIPLKGMLFALQDNQGK